MVRILLPNHLVWEPPVLFQASWNVKSYLLQMAKRACVPYHCQRNELWWEYLTQHYNNLNPHKMLTVVTNVIAGSSLWFWDDTIFVFLLLKYAGRCDSVQLFCYRSELRSRIGLKSRDFSRIWWTRSIMTPCTSLGCCDLPEHSISQQCRSW